MKLIPIKYTTEMVNDSSLKVVQRSLQTLDETVQYIQDSISSGMKQINEVMEQMRIFDIDHNMEMVDSISVEFKQIMSPYGIIGKMKSSLATINGMLSENGSLSALEKMLDEIDGGVDGQSGGLMYDLFELVQKLPGGSQIEYVPPTISNPSQITPAEMNNDVVSYSWLDTVDNHFRDNIWTSVRFQYCLFGAMLFSKFNVNPNNIWYSFNGIESQPSWGCDTFGLFQTVDESRICKITDLDKLNPKGKLLIYQQGIRKADIESYKKGESILPTVDQLNDLFQSSKATFAIITTSKYRNLEEELKEAMCPGKPILIWYCTLGSTSSKSTNKRYGQPITYMLYELLSNDMFSKTITYEQAFAQIQPQFPNMKPIKLNDFDETKPIFTYD